jgi:acylphosphatase
MQRRVRIIVTGRVQGVFFRASTVDLGHNLGLTGHARNLADGSVEIEAQGEGDAVAKMCEWAKRGPPLAQVTSCEVSDLALVDGERGFVVRR